MQKRALLPTETGKGTCRSAASFSHKERKVGVGLLDGLVVGLEELSVRLNVKRMQWNRQEMFSSCPWSVAD